MKIWESVVFRVAISLLALMLVSACSNSESSGNKVDAALSTNTSGGSPGDSYGDLQVVGNLPTPSVSGGGNNQPIAANDLIEVDVFQVDDLDKTARVDSAGNVSLPLIGSIKVAGLTVEQAERELESRYGARYLQSPDISIFVKESAGERVTMDGQFMKPGIYPTTSQTSLQQAVALAGGLSPIADESKLYVFREINGKKLVANYSLKDIREGKKADPKLYGGDTVVAFTSKAKVAAQNLREALGIATGAARLATPL